MKISWITSFKDWYRTRMLRIRCASLVDQITTILNKNNSTIPVFVVSYNNGTYVENTVNQFRKLNIKPIIIDNHSSDNASLEILRKINASGMADIVFSPINFGHFVGFIEPIYNILPDIFAYTDPDLQYSSKMPKDFLEVLAEMTSIYSVFKAGLALAIPADIPTIEGKSTLQQTKPIRVNKEYSVQEKENKYWRMRIVDHEHEVYAAKIDTTFAVYRKSNYHGDFFDAVRVAGNFSAIHLPWFPSLDMMSEHQRTSYIKGNKSSSWIRES